MKRLKIAPLVILPAILFSMSLTGCSSLPAVAPTVVKTEYVRQQIPDPPAEPDYYPVTFNKSGDSYMLDEGNAKALLMNRELDKGYREELKSILMNLKGQK